MSIEIEYYIKTLVLRSFVFNESLKLLDLSSKYLTIIIIFFFFGKRPIFFKVNNYYNLQNNLI